MFVVNDDLSIYANRGDIVFFSVMAMDGDIIYKFQPGDIVRMAIYGKKEAETCVLQKDFPVTEVTDKVFIFLEEQDTKIGEIISKHKDYWYEVVLNPDTMPQTIIGYDEDGAKVFRLFPESVEIDDNYEPKEEDFPVVDSELDLTSPRPVANSAIARSFATMLGTFENAVNEVTSKGEALTEQAESLKSGKDQILNEIATERNRVDYLSTYNTPQMFGAVGDGVADDTKALKDALSSGKNVHLPEGTYITNEPLYVNVNTTKLTGDSSRSVFKAGSRFPDGESVITFYSPNGDYYTRSNRECVHGGFAVVGRDKNCDGVRIGGAVGTKYEGHVEASIFQNIFVDNCNAAYLWGAHAYRNTMLQCDSHSNNYSLKTTSDIKDTGEVFTCINCGFWSGALYIANAGELVMIACTIHTKPIQTVSIQNIVGDVKVTHYFNNTHVTLQNCHIEAIVLTTEERDMVRPTTFYAENSLLYFNECSAVVSGEYIVLNQPMFVDESNNGYAHGIFVNGGNWKYYFGRVKLTQLTRGYVQFKNVMLKYLFDGISLPYKIYDKVPYVSLNRNGKFDHYYGLNESQVNVVSTKKDLGYLFTITLNEYVATSAIGFYRKVDISNYKTCKLLGTVYNLTDGCKSTLSYQNTAPSIIMFADMFDNFIEWGSNNVNLYADAQYLDVNGRFIAIPPNAKYAYIGFDIRKGGGFNAGTYEVESTMTYEFI